MSPIARGTTLWLLWPRRRMAVWRGQRAALVLALMPRRFPPPWSVEEPDPKLDRQYYIVRDANGHALAYDYFEEEPGRRSAALASEGAPKLAASKPLAVSPPWVLAGAAAKSMRALRVVVSVRRGIGRCCSLG